MSGNIGVKKLISLILTGALLMCVRVPYAQAQDKEPIIIDFGQPNIWSLEQAHYLLNRLRARSFGIKTVDLNNLDPNEVNGTRLDVLKTLISGGVGFNQAVGLNNELFENNSRFSLQRRQDLLTRRDTLQAQLRDATVQLAALKVQREGMNGTAFTDAQRSQKDVEITEQTKVRDLLTSDINSTTTEINGLPAAPTAAQTPTPPEASTSSTLASVSDKLLEDAEFRKNLSGMPKINATTKLDNDINLQYEIIAKQLTLLREEIGRGQRLVFLELPQTFYTVPDKSNRKLAQVWWRIQGFTKRDASVTPSSLPTPSPSPTPTATPNCSPDPNAWRKAVKSNPYTPPEAKRNQLQILTDTTPDIKRYVLKEPTKPNKDQNQNEPKEDNSQTESQQDKKQNKPIENMPHYELQRDTKQNAANNDAANSDTNSNNEAQAESEARALDLIPRQSALNVNDIQDRQKNLNIMGVFTLLSGVGARVGFERQRRLYEQFIGQEIYASAFGKGLTDFGWTFGPLPGSERIATGLHTTYAVLLIPADAETITLQARGCYFSRTKYAPSAFDATPDDVRCTASKSFKMLVPGTSENNFWVTGVDFKPVKPGNYAVVHIHGDYFSPQIGVLVDGLPLRHEIGLAQIELSLGRSPNDNLFDPAGSFEFVNSNELVLAFKKDNNYRGTPSITLISPGRSIEINKLRLVINDSYKQDKSETNRSDTSKSTDSSNQTTDNATNRGRCYKVPGDSSIYVTLDEFRDKMFSPDVAFGVTALDVVKSETDNVKAQLTGTGFRKGADVYVNGEKVSKLEFITSGVMLVDFKPPNREIWNVTVVQGEPSERVSTTLSTPNPLVLKVTRSEVIHYEAAVKDKPDKPGFLQARVQGIGFSSSLIVTARRASGPVPLVYTFVSQNEIIVEITAPEEIEIVNLRDPTTGASTGTTIVRPKAGS